MCVSIPSGNQTWLAGLLDMIYYVAQGRSGGSYLPSHSVCITADGPTPHPHLCSSITVNPMFHYSINYKNQLSSVVQHVSSYQYINFLSFLSFSGHPRICRFRAKSSLVKNHDLLVVWTPRKNMSQLGWWHSQLILENNPVMFQSPPTRWYIIKFHYISHNIPLNIKLNHIKSPLNPITPPFSHGCPTCFR